MSNGATGFDAGVQAFQQKNFALAIELLTIVLDEQPQNWLAKLYLAMSYFSNGDIVLAAGHFRVLCNKCEDPSIQAKAKSALSAIDAQLIKGSQAKVNQLPQQAAARKATPVEKYGRMAVNGGTVPTKSDDEIHWID
jgi:thioredoxin-like negative regulator of GroEL